MYAIVKKVERANISKPKEPTAFRGNPGTFSYAVSYNGEKNLGEIGPIKDYKLDYDALRMRSWQCYLESEIARTIINKFIIWKIGTGLNLQCNPNQVVLKSEGIILEEGFTESFNELAENRFSIYSNSIKCDYSGMNKLHQLAWQVDKNATIGGDVLVILRYVDKWLKVEIKDGQHVCNPLGVSDYLSTVQANGNRICNGIELSPSGEHIAYWVRTAPSGTIQYKYERVEAKSQTTGLTMAYLVYGDKHRLDNYRGIPLLAVVLESLKKLERYKEATIGSAEERQKIVFAIEHNEISDGSNPMLSQMVKAQNYNEKTDELPEDVSGVQLADNIAATTNKQTYNLPRGAKLSQLTSDNELAFKDFYDTNINIVAACMGIPPNVAMSLYNDSFSASRAALKDWEHVLNVSRQQHSDQFMDPIYKFWAHIEILTNKINAPGYLQAFMSGNSMIVDSYLSTHYTGANVPHIDPLKEVKAEREKLGITAETIPLTTVEAATRALNGGESDSNMKQYSRELKRSKKLYIIAPKPKEKT